MSRNRWPLTGSGLARASSNPSSLWFSQSRILPAVIWRVCGLGGCFFALWVIVQLFAFILLQLLSLPTNEEERINPSLCYCDSGFLLSVCPCTLFFIIIPSPADLFLATLAVCLSGSQCRSLGHSVCQLLWLRLQYLNNCWTDLNGIPCIHSWPHRG